MVLELFDNTDSPSIHHKQISLKSATLRRPRVSSKLLCSADSYNSNLLISFHSPGSRVLVGRSHEGGRKRQRSR